MYNKSSHSAEKFAINAKNSAIVRNNPILSANTDIISSATLPPQNLNKNRTIARIAL